jgi:hypothetical protein
MGMETVQDATRLTAISLVVDIWEKARRLLGKPQKMAGFMRN